MTWNQTNQERRLFLSKKQQLEDQQRIGTSPKTNHHRPNVTHDIFTQNTIEIKRYCNKKDNFEPWISKGLGKLLIKK